MRIALITFSRAKNYGGILQAYALYKQLEKMGNKVVFVDYIMERSNIYKPEVFVNNATTKSRIWGINIFTRWIWKTLYFNNIKEDYLKFSRFIERECDFTKQYFSYKELKKDPPLAELYIAGSDQIWNSDYAPFNQLELPFYLSFVQGNKISYASSFGNSRIPEDHKGKVKELLADFDVLSVREESGKDILEELELKSSVVLDPTLLFSGSFWNQKCKPIKVNEPYILLYQVKYDANIYGIAKKFSEKLGCKLLILSMNQKDKRDYIDSVIMTPDVGEWLSYIRGAKLVYTDSFHATVFSLLFHVPFIVNSASRKNMSTRITNLLNIVDLKELEMTNFNIELGFNKINQNIDWDRTDSLIDKHRVFSEKWLIDAIKKVSE